MTLRIGSLCSGYGGLDMSVMDVLDAEVAWHAQYDPDDRHQYAAQILAHHWPGLPNHGDITAIDWAAVEPVDILTAGFPCQPVSNAGKRKGHEDERWLWPDVEAAIRRIQPRLVFLENVSALANRGGDTVLGALAALGFDAEWTCLRASDIGAPHRRDRWFCLAWPASDPAGLSQREPADAPLAPTGSREAWEEPGRRGARAPADSQGLGWVEGRTESARELGGSDASFGGGAAPADADRAGALAERDGEPDRSETVDEHAVQDVAGRVLGWGPYAPAIERWGHVMGRPAPAPTEPGKNGPRLAPRFVEWLMGLRDGHVTAVPGIPRNAQLKALGNGVVHHQGAAALRLLLDRLEH